MDIKELDFMLKALSIHLHMTVNELKQWTVSDVLKAYELIR